RVAGPAVSIPWWSCSTAVPLSKRSKRRDCASGGVPISACPTKCLSRVSLPKLARALSPPEAGRAKSMAGSWTATFSNAKARQDNMLPEWVHQECAGISIVHRDAALAHQAQLTKPAGSLGRLESLAAELASLQHVERPRAERAPII